MAVYTRKPQTVNSFWHQFKSAPVMQRIMSTALNWTLFFFSFLLAKVYFVRSFLCVGIYNVGRFRHRYRYRDQKINRRFTPNKNNDQCHAVSQPWNNDNWKWEKQNPVLNWRESPSEMSNEDDRHLLVGNDINRFFHHELLFALLFTWICFPAVVVLFYFFWFVCSLRTFTKRKDKFYKFITPHTAHPFSLSKFDVSSLLSVFFIIFWWLEWQNSRAKNSGSD